MTGSLVSVALFLALLISLPFVLKWLKLRVANGTIADTGQSRFISAVAVGPQQRVVTVEVGPEGRRVWLTLGVTAQNITCLHRAELDRFHEDGGIESSAQLPRGVDDAHTVSSELRGSA